MRIRVAAAVSGAMMLAACGDEPEGGQVSVNQIERLATAPEEPQAMERGVRLQPLGAAPLADTRCRLLRDEALLIAASEAAGVARIAGRIVRLNAEGPVGPTGAYFEAGGISVSIGRTGSAQPGGLNALVQVNDRSAGIMREFDAVWSCGG